MLILNKLHTLPTESRGEVVFQSPVTKISGEVVPASVAQSENEDDEREDHRQCRSGKNVLNNRCAADAEAVQYRKGGYECGCRQLSGAEA